MPRPGGGAGGGMSRGFSRAGRKVAVLLVAVLAAGCGVAKGSTQSASASRVICRVSQAVMPVGLPGFVTMFRQDLPQPPGDRGVQGHPPWDLTQYVCGQGNGFVANDIMYGKYRAQDDALARSLGYQIGRLPLLPYVGTAVSAVPHKVFEAYEVVVQFRSARAAAIWLSGARGRPAAPGGLTGVSLPDGFLARAGVAGPDDGKHEHQIGITGRIGTAVVAVSINGGRDLSWQNARPIWDSAWQRLERSLT